MIELCFKVSGYTLIESDFVPGERTDHDFLVTFKSVEDNRHDENYLRWYLGSSDAEDGKPWHLFRPEMCAIALVTMHLRGSIKRL